jgi:23S rRNA A2030 N6-methylase RlmJ
MEHDFRSEKQILRAIEKKLEEQMATDTEVLDAVTALKTTTTEKLTAIETEIQKLVSEQPNPETLQTALTGIQEVNTAIQNVSVPTT